MYLQNQKFTQIYDIFGPTCSEQEYHITKRGN